MIPSDTEVSKCNQSRWPSNCTGFYGHHVMRNSHIVHRNVASIVLLANPWITDQDLFALVFQPI